VAERHDAVRRLSGAGAVVDSLLDS
jgi:hypothetical protein